MKTQLQKTVQLYVRTRVDIQETRKRAFNRLGMKKDGTMQDVPDRNIESNFFDNLVSITREMMQQEKRIEKDLEILLQKFDIYNNWLQDIKGIGIISSGCIISEFDIEKATTVSKMWQYAGLNPSLVRGNKRIPKADYKAEMGEIITEMKNIKTKKIDYIIKTNEMIRGDRATEGFVLPYNKRLRTHLIGVMAANFVKHQNNYAIEFYYPYKTRLEKEDSIVENKGKKRKGDGKAWKDVSKGHRNNAALRYMVKMFLIDLHVAWRKSEGLDVRKPYAEEYLGKKHGAKAQKKTIYEPAK